MDIETNHSVKLNKTMIVNKEDKLYHETNINCHIYSDAFINEVRDQCHETSKQVNRGPACNNCNLSDRQQKFIPVIFHNGKVYDFNLLFNEIFRQNKGKSRLDVLLMVPMLKSWNV